MSNQLAKISVCVLVVLSGLLTGQAYAENINVVVTTNVVRENVLPLGYNLNNNYYASALTKRREFFNFEGIKYRQVFFGRMLSNRLEIAGGSTNRFYVNGWQDLYPGFSFKVISGPDYGLTGTIVNADTTLGDPWGTGPYFTETLFLDRDTSITDTNGLRDIGVMVWSDEYLDDGYLDNHDSYWVQASCTLETNDSPPSTYGSVSMQMDGSANSCTFRLSTFFETLGETDGDWELNLWTKRVSGSPVLKIKNKFAATETLIPDSSWSQTQLMISVSGAVDGDHVIFEMVVTNGIMLVDDIELISRVGTNSANTTIFRDDFVELMQEFQPGMLRALRMMSPGVSNAIMGTLNEPPNMYAHYLEVGPYGDAGLPREFGYHEFLELCEYVGADPWINLSGALHEWEVEKFVEYLAAPTNTGWGKLRADLGHPEPWTDTFDSIGVEFGNEAWNLAWDWWPAGYNGSNYWRQLISAGKGSSHYTTNILFMTAGQNFESGQAQRILDEATNSDLYAIAPYTCQYLMTNDLALQNTDEKYFQWMMADPMWNVTDRMNGQSNVMKNTGVEYAMYEFNHHTDKGDASADDRNRYLPSVASGVSMANYSMQHLEMHNIRRQCAFQLTHVDTAFGADSIALFGHIVSFKEGREQFRPSFLANLMMNKVRRGNLVETIQSTNPVLSTYGRFSTDTAAAPVTKSFPSTFTYGFKNGVTSGLILVNYNLTTTQNFSIAMTEFASNDVAESWLLVSDSFTNNNESVSNQQVSIEETIVSNYVAGKVVDVPPVSIRVLRWIADGPLPVIETDVSTLRITEGTTNMMSVRLTSAPSQDTLVNVGRHSGDTDLSIVSSTTLTFTASNWDTWQSVSVASAVDGDEEAGTAVIRCESPRAVFADVTALEVETTYALPWMETFENDGTNAGTLGTLNGQHGWDVQPPEAAVVQNTNVYNGTQAAALSYGDVRHRFDDYQTNHVYINIHAKPAFKHMTNRIEAGATTIFWVNQNGYIVAMSNQTAVTLPVTVPSNTWVNFMIHSDYGSKTWDLDFNGSNVAMNLGFHTPANDHFQELWIEERSMHSVVDDIEIDTQSFNADAETDVDAVTVPESGTSNFNVRLTRQPMASLTVEVSRISGDSDITISAGSSLVFTAGNWDTWQSVTLAAANDADMTAGEAEIRCQVVGFGSTDVTATEDDDDNIAIQTSTGTVSVAEGSTANVDIRLASAPLYTVTATVGRASGDTDITVSGSTTFTFTTGNWDTWQTVTLAAAQDADTIDGSAVIRCESPDLAAADVTAVEVDDDTVMIVTETNALSIAEGGSDTVGLKLSYQPASTTTVQVNNVAGDADVTVSGAKNFFFTTANWDTYQTVTFAVAEDDDTSNGSATMRCTSTGLSDGDITVTEIDNDTMAIVTSDSSVTVLEGSNNTFTVKLSNQPGNDTTVSVAHVAGDADISVSSGSSLVFSSANWDTWQTVTLAAAEDADQTDGSATIRCSSPGLANQDVTATENDNDDVTAPTLSNALALDVSTVQLTFDEDVDQTTSETALNYTISDGVTVSSAMRDLVDYSIVELTVSSMSDGTYTVTVNNVEDLFGNSIAANSTISYDYYGTGSVVFWSEPMDTDPGWTTAGQWAFGVPQGSGGQYGNPDPTSGYSSSNVYGYNLNGDYGNSLSATYLTTPAIDCSSYQNIELSFYRYLNVERSRYDKAYLEISTNGTSWSQVWQNPDLATEETSWTNVSYDISSYADGCASVYLRWGHQTDSSWQYSGWNIDDVSLSGESTNIFLLTSTQSVTVAEGGSSSFGVKLSTTPGSSVTVSVSRLSGDTGLSVSSGGTLVFSASNWDTYQDATIAAAQDDNTVSESATFQCAASGVPSRTITAQSTDDDTMTLQVSTNALVIDEGSNSTFEVRLSNQPVNDTTVTVDRASGDADITVSSGNSLVFSSSTWDTWQTVTLAAAEDVDSIDGTATVQCVSAGLSSVNITAVESDNDAAEIQVSTGTVQVAEGSTETFDISLTQQPLSTTTVNVSRVSGDSDITVSAGASLIFTTSDWDTPQTVTLAAAEDLDPVDGNAIIRCTATGLSDVDVLAIEVDDDFAARTTLLFDFGRTDKLTSGNWNNVTQTNVGSVLASTVDTNGFDTGIGLDIVQPFFYRVNEGPTNNVSLPYPATAYEDCFMAWDGILSQGVLRITGLNPASSYDFTFYAGSRYTNSQRLTEFIIGSETKLLATKTNTSETVSITNVTPNGSGEVDVTVGLFSTWGSWSINVMEISYWSGVSVELSTSTLAVAEGSTANFDVRLDNEPLHSVTVTVTRTSGDTDLSVSVGSTLVFTPSTWDTWQTVTLAAAEDDADYVDGQAVFAIDSPDANYRELTATEADNEGKPAILTDTNDVIITEGSSNTFNVALSTNPLQNVTVTVSRASGDVDIAVAGNSNLVFTTANWDTWQSVVLSAGYDSDTVDGVATMVCASAVLDDVYVTAREDDITVMQLLLSTNNVTVTEGGSNSFLISLSANPIPNLVTVQVSFVSGDADLSASTLSNLVFSSGNFWQQQTVYISAAEDDADWVDGTAIFQVTGGGASNKTITASEVDNETQPLLVLSTNDLVVPEGGNNAFDVSLSSSPLVTRTVTVAHTSGDVDVTVASGSSLVFTISNWDTAQSVTLSAAEDADYVAGTAVVSCVLSSSDTALVTAVEGENDVNPLYNLPWMETFENDGTNAGLIGSIHGQHGWIASQTNSALVQTGTYYSGSQAGSIENTVLSHTFEGSETNVWVKLYTIPHFGSEVDSQNTNSACIFWVNNAGNAVAYSNNAVLTNSIITMGAGQWVEFLANVDYENKSWSLWVNSTNVFRDLGFYNTSVGGFEKLSFYANSGTNMSFLDDITLDTANMSPLDIVSDVDFLTVPEGGSNTFNLRLSMSPGLDRTVTVSRTQGDSDISVVSGTSLVFNASNWSNWQSVTLQAAEDDSDWYDSTATISAQSENLSDKLVIATEDDNETKPQIVSSTGTLFVAEGGSNTFSVMLSVNPLIAVTVTTARVSGDSNVVVSTGASLVFTATDWDTWQTVTVSAEEDDLDMADGTAVLQLSSFNMSNQSVSVTEVDNDTQEVMTDVSAMNVPEGSNAAYNVRLARQPILVTTVTSVKVSGDVDITVTGGSTLTFTTNNWDAWQAVTLSAAEDADFIPGSAVIESRISGVHTASVTATESDNDAVPEVLVSTNYLVVPEGGSNTFTVSLGSDPLETRTVTVSRTSGDVDIDVAAGAELVFTTNDWSTTQTVTLSAAVEDADYDIGTAIVSCVMGNLSTTLVTAVEGEDDTNPNYNLPFIETFENDGTNAGTLGALNGQRGWVADSTNAVVQNGTFNGGAQAAQMMDTFISHTFEGGATNIWATFYATPKLGPELGQQNTNSSALFWFDGSGHALAYSNTTIVTNELITVVAGQWTEMKAHLDYGSKTWSLWVNGTNAFRDIGFYNTAIAGFGEMSVHDNTVSNFSYVDDINLDTQGAEPLDILSDVSALTVPEGSTNSFNLKLSRAPTADTTVTVSRTAGDTDVSVLAGGSLVFSSADWDTWQVVTLQAAEDSDWVDGSAVITATGDGLASVPVSATEIENDIAPLIVLSTSAIMVTEGGSEVFGVSLDSDPLSSVTVTAARVSGDTDLSVTAGSTLVFTTTDWDTAQNVTVSAAEDDADLAAGSAVIQLTSPGMSNALVTATEIDNDSQSIVASTNTVIVPEGSNATYSVRLGILPLGVTTVTTAYASGDLDISLSNGGVLTFTTNNWDTFQAIELAAAEDGDFVDGSALFESVTVGADTVTVTAVEADNDAAPSIVTSTSLVYVAEGSTAMFDVQLSADPGLTWTVVVANAAGDADITVSGGAALVFTTGNWSSNQTVTLSAGEDADPADGTATIRCSGTGLADTDVTAHEIDNDTPDQTTLLFDFGRPDRLTTGYWNNVTQTNVGTVLTSTIGTNGFVTGIGLDVVQPFFYRVNEGPTNNVTLPYPASAYEDCFMAWDGILSQGVVRITGLNPARSYDFTFYAGSRYTNSQRYTEFVIGSETQLLATWTNGSETVSITNVTPNASGEIDVTIGLFSTWGSWSINVMEISYWSGVSVELSTNAMSLPEGSSDTFDVRLDGQPEHTVTVSVSRISGDTDIGVLSGSSLLFTPSNWDTWQSVTVSAAEDDLDWENGTATIRAYAPEVSYKLLSVTEQDNESQPVLETPTNVLPIVEGGSTSLMVRLSASPLMTRTVTVAKLSGDADITLTSGTSMVFTVSNWDTWQSAGLAATQDVDLVNGTATVRVSSATLADLDVTVVEQDTSVLSIETSVASLLVAEGSSNSFSLRLSNPPLADTTVSVAHVSGDGDITMVSSPSLVFTSGNYWQYQIVTLEAAEDTDWIDGVASIDATSPGLATQTVTATEIDNETAPTFELSTNLIAIAEGGTNVFLVRLTADPITPLTAAVANVGGDADISVQSGASLVFNSADYTAWQTVTLYATQDVDYVDGVATVQVSAATLSSVTLQAVEIDDDSAPYIIASTNHIYVDEGGSNTFDIMLSSDPVDALTVKVSRAWGDSDHVVAGTSNFIFTTANWDTWQTVTIAALENDTEWLWELSGFICSLGYTNTQVQVRENDNETAPDIELSTNALSVAEGSTNTFGIRLTADPLGAWTAHVGRVWGDTDITVNGGTNFIFTSADWTNWQTAVLSAAQDADSVDGVATVRVSSAWIGSQELTATEVDDDTGVPDSDGDGIPDWFENEHGGGVTNLDASADDDGDGRNNLEEWISLTEPTNALSVLKIDTVTTMTASDYYVISWESASGRVYGVNWISDLDAIVKVPIMTNITALPPMNIITDETHTVEDQGYYQIDVRLP